MADEIENSKEVKNEFKATYCPGCRDNFYNGNNPLEIKECWCLSSARKVQKKKIGMNDVPPWNHTPFITLSCYHAEGYWMVAADRTF